MSRRKVNAPSKDNMDNIVRNIRRRKSIDTSEPYLGAKQQQIASMTAHINNEERKFRDRMVREMEKAIQEQSDLATRVNLQNALDRFRAGHIDDGVNLVDLSGKVRTVAEADELLSRLTTHKMQARTDRMRANYDQALRAKGYNDVADYVSGLSDEKFLIGFYFGNNLQMGFEYRISTDGESVLLENWRDIERVIHGKSNKRSRAKTMRTIERVNEQLGR